MPKKSTPRRRKVTMLIPPDRPDLPVHDLIVPESPIPVTLGYEPFESRLKCQKILNEELVKKSCDLIVHRDSDKVALQKAAERAGVRIWTLRLPDTTPGAQTSIFIRLRRDGEVINPLFVHIGNHPGKVRGRWRAMALTALARGKLTVKGPRPRADKVVLALMRIALHYVEAGMRPPATAYTVEKDESAKHEQWVVTIEPAIRRQIIAAIEAGERSKDLEAKKRFLSRMARSAKKRLAEAAETITAIEGGSRAAQSGEETQPGGPQSQTTLQSRVTTYVRPLHR